MMCWSAARAMTQSDGNDGNDLITRYDIDKALDRLFGGNGNDRMFGGRHVSEMRGGSGNDTIFGGPLADEIFGEDGDDRLLPGHGNNVVRGGNGNDVVIAGNGDDQIFGEDGDDRLLGSAGNDLLVGGSGRDRLIGREGNDTINGGDDNDVIRGDDGVDIIDGGRGDDFVIGGAGNDQIEGNLGTDRIRFNARQQDFSVVGTNPSQVTDIRATPVDGSDRVSGAEAFIFSDGRTGPGPVTPPPSDFREVITVQPIVVANNNGSSVNVFWRRRASGRNSTSHQRDLCPSRHWCCLADGKTMEQFGR